MFPSNIWISDPNAGKLYKYENESVAQVITTDTTDGLMHKARAVLVSQDMSNVYTVNWGSDSISQIKDGVYVRDIPVGKTPYGICEDSKGNIYVTNYGDNTVTKITKGAVVATISVHNGPRGICCNSRDRIYVACYLSNKGTSVDFGGLVDEIVNNTVVNSIEVGNAPKAVTCDPYDNIWVANYGSNSVSKIKQSAKVLDIALPDDGKGPSAIVTNSNGKVYVANYLGNSVTILSDGIVKKSIGVGSAPTAISVIKDDTIYVLSDLDSVMTRISPDDSSADIPVCANPSGFGDFTGCSMYNLFHSKKSSSGIVPNDGWGLNDLHLDIQNAIQKILSKQVETSADLVSYHNSTYDTVEKALDAILGGTITSNSQFVEDIMYKNPTSEGYTKLIQKLGTINNPVLIKVDDGTGTNTTTDLESRLSAISTKANKVQKVEDIEYNAATPEGYTKLSQKLAGMNNPALIKVDDGTGSGNKVGLDTRLSTIAAAAGGTPTVESIIFTTPTPEGYTQLSQKLADINNPAKIKVDNGNGGTTDLNSRLTSIVQNAKQKVEDLEYDVPTTEGYTKLSQKLQDMNDPAKIKVDDGSGTSTKTDLETRLASIVTKANQKVEDIKFTNPTTPEGYTNLSQKLADINDPTKIQVSDGSPGNNKVSLEARLTTIANAAAGTQEVEDINYHTTTPEGYTKLSQKLADINNPAKIKVDDGTGNSTKTDLETRLAGIVSGAVQKVESIEYTTPTTEGYTKLSQKLADINDPTKIKVDDGSGSSVKTDLETRLAAINTLAKAEKHVEDITWNSPDSGVNPSLATNLRDILTKLKDSNKPDKIELDDGSGTNKPLKDIIEQLRKDIAANAASAAAPPQHLIYTISEPSIGSVKSLEFMTTYQCQITEVAYAINADATITQDLTFALEICGPADTQYKTLVNGTYTLSTSQANKFVRTDISSITNPVYLADNTRIRIKITAIGSSDTVDGLNIRVTLKKKDGTVTTNQTS